MPTPPYGRATAPWVRFCHILHSTHHSARSRRTRAVSDSTASSGRNSASSRSPALVLGCPFLSFSSTFRSRHQSLYLSSMVGYSNPEIQICKSAKDTRGATLRDLNLATDTDKAALCLAFGRLGDSRILPRTLHSTAVKGLMKCRPSQLGS